MPNTRREFLQSGAAVAVSLLGGVATTLAAEPAAKPEKMPKGVLPATGQSAGVDAEVQVPRITFGDVEIGRLILGVNPFYGFAHYNNNFGTTMKEWYTPDKVCEVMHRCNRFGINAFNYVDVGRSPQDWARFQAEGGKMHLIIQVTGGDDTAALARNLKPLALQRQGEVVDRAYQDGKMDTVKEWCKRARDMGVLVGVGTHKPEVIELVEEQNWDVDFYAGCVYNRTRTAEEQKQVLNGQTVEMPGELYLQSDPARMYKVIRQTRKTCFAFKILAAGRVGNVEQAFRTAFESIKPQDGVFVGMFPRSKDEVKEDAEIVHNLLTSA